MNYENIIKFNLDLLVEMPDSTEEGITMISINFSEDDEFEPFLLQGGYDPLLSLYWVLVAPLNNHFYFDAEYEDNLYDFNKLFINRYDMVNKQIGNPKEIDVVALGRVVVKYKFSENDFRECLANLGGSVVNFFTISKSIIGVNNLLKRHKKERVFGTSK